MSLVNESQLLVRNMPALTGENPLFVNFPADSFISEYLMANPTANVTSYSTNFEQHVKLQEMNSAPNASFKFCTQYQTKIKHDVIVVLFPKSKAELGFTLAMLHACATPDAKVYIVGNNKSGISSVAKLTKNYLTFCQKIDSARHCSIYSCGYLADLPEFQLNTWFQTYKFSIADQHITISSLPGVFSQKQLDKGTALLLENLPEAMQGKVLDFGCGAGVISAFIGKVHSNVQLTLVDVSALALTSAERTLAENGLAGEYIASNSLSSVNDSYQHVVSNPPFHQGVKTNYVATETFLSAIKKHINKKGSITIVANSFLQYLPIMQKSIGNTKRVEVKNGFTIYHCEHN